MRTLRERKIPKVQVSSSPETDGIGTTVTIYGYNQSRRDQFTHDNIRDYIKWFTRAGSIQWIFSSTPEEPVQVYLKGLDRNDPETLDARHDFGKRSPSVSDLFDEYSVKAPDHYCSRVIREGNLKRHPEIAYQAVFSIEGSQVKYDYNTMLRRQGYQAPRGAYKVQDRYGLWLCKDFIPIQRKNEWLPTLKTEWTRLHAFINCQEFQLTANRGSVENTPSEILDDLREEVIEIYNDIIASDDWDNLQWLESEASAYRTVEKEERDFERRRQRLNQANIVQYEKFTLIEPQRESGVFALFLQLSILNPDLFPFQVLDYDTHEGIDVIVKGDHTTPIVNAKLFYVEFKHQLEPEFNHSFDNLHSVVCWDTQVKHDEIVECLGGTQRTMKIVSPESSNDYTRFFLEDPRKSHRIEVFVLKHYLPEKLQIQFAPRTDKDTV